MEENIFDVNVDTVVCKYIEGKDTNPTKQYVSAETYDALLSNYYKVKGRIPKKIMCEEIRSHTEEKKCVEYPKHEYCKCGFRQTEKPPLGVKPCFIHAEERIIDLADGISRYAHKGDYEIIKKWAREICLQCDIAEMEKDVK